MKKKKVEIVLDSAALAAHDARRIDLMNAHALRIWDGQSIDLPRAERIERIKAGLIEQGYADFTQLRLPE